MQAVVPIAQKKTYVHRILSQRSIYGVLQNYMASLTFKILEPKNKVASNLPFPPLTEYTLPSSNFMDSLCFQEIILRLKKFTIVNLGIPEGYREKCSIHRENYTRFTNMDGGEVGS